MASIDGFSWTTREWGAALRSAPLDGVADHFFTTRQLRLRGASEAEDWRTVAAAIGVPPSRLIRLTQVHGRGVFVFRGGATRTENGTHRTEAAGGRAADVETAAGDPSDSTMGGPDWPEADIVMTDDPSVALAIQVADCVPLLLADTRSGAVAAVHAGWRGTAAGAAPTAVAALAREFGARPDTLLVAQGPSIGPCCYAVGDELVDAFRAAGFTREVDRWFTRDGDGGLRLDLWTANRDQLLASGVPAAAIHQAGLCTASHPELFASYRRDGPGTGRIAAVIRSRGNNGER
jgi:YfiH family protein